MYRASGTQPGRRQQTLMATTTVLIAVGVTGALAGCGGSSGSTAKSGSSGVTTIKLGTLSPSANQAPIYVAQNLGLYKKAGIKVDVTNFTGGGANSSAALASGAVDVAVGGPGSFLGSMAKKAIHGKIFSQLIGQQFDLVVSKGISSVDDLKGKTIGVSGINSNDDIFMEALLQHEGLLKGDYTVVTAGNPTNRYAALSSGKIQATVETDSQRAVSAKTGTVLVKSEDSAVRMPGQVFYASDNYLSDNKPALKKFVQATAQAAAWAKKPENLAAATKACMSGTSATKEICESAIKFMYGDKAAKNGDWTSTFALSKAGMTSAIQTTGLLVPQAKDLKYADVVSSEIVTPSK